MSGILVAMQGAVAQGVLWGIMVLGVYITYRLLDIADLTVDGSFALGGCVCAALVINFDLDPLAALLLSMLAGMAAGSCDGDPGTRSWRSRRSCRDPDPDLSVVHKLTDHERKIQSSIIKAENTHFQRRRQPGVTQAPGVDPGGRGCGRSHCGRAVLVFRNRDRKRSPGHGKQRGHDPRPGSQCEADEASGTDAKQRPGGAFRSPGVPAPEICGYQHGPRAPSSSAWLPLSSARCSWDGSLTLPAS